MHYEKIDTRIQVVRDIISPLKNQFDDIVRINKKNGNVYWDEIFADDTEHLIGIIFIILQNYINSSISDLYPDLKNIYLKYDVDKKITNTQITRIKLIITAANYYKHRDLPTALHGNTTKVLENLNISYKDIYNEQNPEYFHKIGAGSPVFSALNMLSQKWDIEDLINIVCEWRENLWILEEKNRLNL